MSVLLPVELAHRLVRCTDDRRWLIEGLWAEEAVGIIGGEPKCCKSFLALDVAVAVAQGGLCLGRFPAARAGRVLLYAAEDASHVVRDRLDGIERARGADLESLDIQVITAPSLRLDLDEDRRRLWETIAALKPTLLVLDPFVRLHRIDENVSGEVAPLLAYLRDLQRRFSVAVAVVHHAKKGAAKMREGQALRGSSEFHAWGDSNLFLRRNGDQLKLSIEHRAAPSVAGIPLALRDNNGALALAIEEASTLIGSAHVQSHLERVENVLREASTPLSAAALRNICRMRTQKLVDVLRVLLREQRITKTVLGYQLVR
jgi:hypothetical protein